MRRKRGACLYNSVVDEKPAKFQRTRRQAKLALGKYPLVLCDLDLAPQNINRLEGDSLYFIN